MNEINDELSDLQNLIDLGDNIINEELEKYIERLNQRKKNLCQSKLELILTECSAKNTNFLFRKIINKIYDFGVLHSAISLDGTIIEWGRGPLGQHLVCPNLDIKEFLFAFEVKAKTDPNFFKYLDDGSLE